MFRGVIPVESGRAKDDGLIRDVPNYSKVTYNILDRKDSQMSDGFALSASPVGLATIHSVPYLGAQSSSGDNRALVQS